jgi:hypothetical protein
MRALTRLTQRVQEMLLRVTKQLYCTQREVLSSNTIFDVPNSTDRLFSGEQAWYTAAAQQRCIEMQLQYRTIHFYQGGNLHRDDDL